MVKAKFSSRGEGPRYLRRPVSRVAMRRSRLAVVRGCLALSLVAAVVFSTGPAAGVEAAVQRAALAGYLGVPNGRVEQKYNAGFSMYVAAWPLLEQYPGNRFQSGLFGTWMHPYYERRPAEQLYSDIEGGLGWWHDTRFATETPKFIMGGVALNFVAWANGPGAGKGRDWTQPKGKYGVAQLSPWLLWPPDGLNLKQGACGELFGYGYLPLPLTRPKSVTAGKPVPTGNQCWTLFLNTANFKGPVAFFTPSFWSRPSVEKPRLAGMFLDSRPSQSNRPLQMETQYIPAAIATDAKGDTYARVARILFPWGSDGEPALVHQIRSYTRGALWDAVKAWFEGGPPASGRIDVSASRTHTIPGRGWASWRIYTYDMPKEKRPAVAWNTFATPVAKDPATFGFRWNKKFVRRKDTKEGPLAVLPEYYRLVKRDGRARWEPIAPEEVPANTGLAKVAFPRPAARPAKPYTTPTEPDSCWKKPGPVAGPFERRLGDGSRVVYYWYRFADQPALLNADLTDQEREELQARVELLHRHWKKNRDYLPPPKTGTLASIDPALLVTPPPGLEVGYVPIVTWQGPAK